MTNGLEFFKQSIGKEAKDGSPSPFGRWLNGKLIEADEGFIKVEYLVRPEFANPAGMIHGGAYAAIFDEVMGMTTFTLNQSEFFAAINLNIDFLRPSQVGETITIQSEVVRAGRTMAHVEAKILGPEGKLRAKASSNLIKTAFPH
ncbi:PaaI family thioesterase [Jiulongibacter sediminis]|jgi:uncharacterized protein (TIGR00369 family)|uniref:PaaI family thioesterase n=1 Tax=Jiulongibacter sediminis TaxID=1605367 RepID=UPI0026EE3BC9|nr:PaaI family thioesterase [Jiulongibacter sediminis]